jgi:hypothetical protein
MLNEEWRNCRHCDEWFTPEEYVNHVRFVKAELRRMVTSNPWEDE